MRLHAEDRVGRAGDHGGGGGPLGQHEPAHEVARPAHDQRAERRVGDRPGHGADTADRVGRGQGAPLQPGQHEPGQRDQNGRGQRGDDGPGRRLASRAPWPATRAPGRCRRTRPTAAPGPPRPTRPRRVRTRRRHRGSPAVSARRRRRCHRWRRPRGRGRCAAGRAGSRATWRGARTACGRRPCRVRPRREAASRRPGGCPCPTCRAPGPEKIHPRREFPPGLPRPRDSTQPGQGRGRRTANGPPGRLIGVRAATKLATDAGAWRQINRAGIPMMWPLFRALGGDDDGAEYQRDTTARHA